LALRALLGDAPIYATAVPAKKKHKTPLLIRASEVNAWEKFLVVTDAAAPGRLQLQSLASKQYLTVPEAQGRNQVMLAGAATPGERETFARVGTRRNFALKAWNGLFVVAVPDANGSYRLEPTAEESAQAARFALEYVRP
jgi:hypothetical protein